MEACLSNRAIDKDDADIQYHSQNRRK